MRKLAMAISMAALLAAGSACEKDPGTNIKGSGSLSDSERSLMAHLPSGAQVVFGGNYERFMKHWADSPIKALSEQMMAMAGQNDQMSSYMNCWLEVGGDLKLAGSLEISDGAGTMRMVFSGLKVSALESCAQKGGMQVKKDADGKYVELQGVSDGMGGTSNVGYYFIDDSTALFAMNIPFGGFAPKPEMASRATLEADIKRAASSPAVDSAAIKELIKKADRSKAFWFSGSAKGTPAADKLSAGHGWMDMDGSGLSVGFSVELADPQMAAEAVSAFKKASGQLGMLDAMGPQGAELKKAAKSFLEDAHLTNKGGTLNGRFKVSNKVMEIAIPAVTGMMGMGLGR